MFIFTIKNRLTFKIMRVLILFLLYMNKISSFDFIETCNRMTDALSIIHNISLYESTTREYGMRIEHLLRSTKEDLCMNTG